MIDDKNLRARILSALSTGMLATAFDVVACGSSDETARQGLESVSCPNNQSEVQCWAPHSTHFAVGNTPPGTVVTTPEPVFDSNGCQIQDQVADGCCNHAAAGPVFDNGQCCYAFCTGACCGRPFVVDGVSRVAPVVERADWSRAAVAARTLDGLAPDVRARIFDEWLADALMEHASIASFARFTLDLLAFGAPPDLVADAQRAALDEVEHARACFAVAGAYAGAAVGPGPFDLGRVGVSSSLAAAAAAALREGCVGESAAALLASDRARATEIPELRAVYERIAEDEARHAELAFRFVAWAVATGGDEVRSAISSAVPGVGSAVPGTGVSEAGNATLRAHGRLSDLEIQDAERRALSEVVVPCLGAMLAPHGTRTRGARTARSPAAASTGEMGAGSG